MSGIVGKNLDRGSGVVKATPVGADVVSGANIADDAIDSEHYADGSIDNAHIADDAIDSEHYADGSIDNAHIADDAIDSEHYAAGSIDTAHIADNQITLAKMAGGTDGQIISYDASGDPVALGPGNDGQVLTSAGAGAPPVFEDAAGGGAWTLIGTQVASDSASLTQTGLDSTYDTYVIVFSDIIPATDGAFPWLRFGDSGGVDSGGSDYTWYYQDIRSENAAWSANVSTGDSKILASNDVGSSTGEGFGAVFYLHRPGDGTSYPQISGTMAYMDSSGQHKGGLTFGHRISVITLDRVNFLFSSGNIASGRMSIFGISHT